MKVQAADLRRGIHMGKLDNFPTNFNWSREMMAASVLLFLLLTACSSNWEFVNGKARQTLVARSFGCPNSGSSQGHARRESGLAPICRVC